MSTKINFDAVSGGDFAPLPENRYGLECIKAELATSSKGNPMIKTSFKVIDEGEYEGRRVWNDFSLMPAAWFNIKNCLVGAGVDLNGEYTPEELADLLEGIQVSGYITQSTYNNKTSNKVGNWTKVGAETEDSLYS